MNSYKKGPIQLTLLILAFLHFTGCTHSVVNPDISNPHINSDEKISLSSTFPPAIDWSSDKLSKARKYANKIGSSSVIVIYDGKLVAEWGDTTKRIKSHSVRKSLLSALYGVAVEKKLIDLNATMDELGIDDLPPPLTEQEKLAKVSDLLKARSGIYHPAAKETSHMKKKRPKRGSHPPGTFWYYNNWDFNAHGTIFENETGMKIGNAFKIWIALPIDMQDFRENDVSYETESDSIHASYPFWISARDLARFGVLYLNNGECKGKQIIPDHWIKESTSAHTDWEKGGYGYMWWTTQTGAYFASGFGGQTVLIVPHKRLVVVNRVDTGAEGSDRVMWFLFGKKVNMDQFSNLVSLILEASPANSD